MVVIGAGQAGLALGYFLRQQNLRFVILEAGDGIGTAWRERWDSLILFTSRRYDALPGLDFPGDPDGSPPILPRRSFRCIAPAIATRGPG